jgi:DNA anti-recombination protein RmuC
MATRMNLRSQRTIQDREELIEIGEKEGTPMEVVSDFENGGETEEAAKGGKDGIADVQRLLLSFMRQMQESNDRMTKGIRESNRLLNEIQESNDGLIKEIQENNNSIMKVFQENRDQLENMLQEIGNEIRAPKYRTTTRASEQVQENDQRINENENELKDIETE